METSIVLTTFSRVRASAYLVHCQTDSFMCLDRKSSEAHGSHNEMLHDVLNRFHHVERYRIAFEVKEVADEDWSVFLVNKFRVLLELLIVASACGKLEGCDGLRVPGMLYSVLSVVELSEIRQEIIVGRL